MCDYDDVCRFVFFFFEGRGRGGSGEVGVSFEGDEYIRVRELGVRWGIAKRLVPLGYLRTEKVITTLA